MTEDEDEIEGTAWARRLGYYAVGSSVERNIKRATYRARAWRLAALHADGQYRYWFVRASDGQYLTLMEAQQGFGRHMRGVSDPALRLKEVVNDEPIEPFDDLVIVDQPTLYVAGEKAPKRPPPPAGPQP